MKILNKIKSSRKIKSPTKINLLINKRNKITNKIFNRNYNEQFLKKKLNNTSNNTVLNNKILNNAISNKKYIYLNSNSFNLNITNKTQIKTYNDINKNQKVIVNFNKNNIAAIPNNKLIFHSGTGFDGYFNKNKLGKFTKNYNQPIVIKNQILTKNNIFKMDYELINKKFLSNYSQFDKNNKDNKNNLAKFNISKLYYDYMDKYKQQICLNLYILYLLAILILIYRELNYDCSNLVKKNK